MFYKNVGYIEQIFLSEKNLAVEQIGTPGITG